MSEKPQSTIAWQRLASAGIGAAVSTLLFAACFMIPPAGIFLCLLVPFPAFVLRFSHGRGMGTAVTFGASGLVALLFGNNAAFLYLAQFGVISMLIPEFLAKGLGAARSIAWAMAVNLLICSLAAASFVLISGLNIHQQAAAMINASFAKALSIYEGTGFKGEDLVMIKQSMALTAEVLTRTYPAVITVLLTAVGGFNVLLVKRFAARLTYAPEIGEFKSFKNPEHLVWLLIVSGFSQLLDNPLITTPALNLLILLGVLYLLQGMAVVLTVIERSSFAMTLRIMLYVMIVFQPYIVVPLTAIGIFDLWGDFRTPRKQENL